MKEMANFIHFSAAENRPTIPGILISGRYKRPYGYKVKRSQGTKDYYLTYTLSGRGWFYNGEEYRECREGEVSIITPGTPHYYGTSEGASWEFYWCHFVPREQWMNLLQFPEPLKGIKWTHIENRSLASKLYSAFSNLVRYNAETDAFAERLSLNALEEVLLLISKSIAAEAQNFDPRIEEAIHILSQHFTQSLTVPGIAAKVNLSPSRFAHLFKEQTGEAVMEMLIKIRLRHAKKLLELTSMSVAEIALEAGFNNPFYFTRQFTSFFGCPPATYRKQKQHVHTHV